MRWTDEQQKVIDLRDRNILVSAAAGLRQDGSARGADHPEAHRGNASRGCEPPAHRDIYRGSGSGDERADRGCNREEIAGTPPVTQGWSSRRP